MHLLTSRRLVAALVSTLMFGVSSAAEAGIFRAYLSKSGSDAGPCTLQQPCRLLPAALAAVNDGGEIWILDSANYNTGPVNIDKSVTVLAVPGATGSVAGSGGNAITIGAGIHVTLRNLNVIDLGTGTNGISATGADAMVTVEGCEIFGFTAGAGILIDAPARISIIDSTARDNQHGIVVDQGGTATVVRTKVLNNTQVGIHARPTVDSTVNVVVSDSVVSGNERGLVANGASAERRGNLYAVRTVASDNVGAGFSNEGAYTVVTLSNSMSTGNTIGVLVADGAVTYSTGTNLVYGNTTTDVLGALTPLALK